MSMGRLARRTLAVFAAAIALLLAIVVLGLASASDDAYAATADESAYTVLADAKKPCNVKSLWASQHDVGRVLFKWTKESSFKPSGWEVKYRTRKIGGNNKWSGWTTKSFGASTMQYWCQVKADYVVEIHARAKGDTSWSQGIITCPAGGKYQAMKTVRVYDALAEKNVTSITFSLSKLEGTILMPNYEYPVKDYKKRPRLYPNHALWDLDAKGKEILYLAKESDSPYSITEDYTGGMVDGYLYVVPQKVGTANLICRAPNGRTQVVKITVKP